ncbi:hypothetical protein QYE76_031405 [Lolium multiflorum]|uniref:Transposase (putative) gypsy type domain-containing protein n=1 Tax=Lolium multiflorum TaxID=4521 RepID=A0AAD8QS40_LOLMU|nr:hypothetical protein QYE76_031405 [Lolium multiflorum]
MALRAARGRLVHDGRRHRALRLRRIPPQVVTRAPGTETEPAPHPGERVVFGAHFDRGLGLLASPFFKQFLEYFGLQPHHLPANAFVQLSCFVAFMEGYAGLWPDIEFWCRLFFLKTRRPAAACEPVGPPPSTPRQGTPFPKIPTVDSVKKWQQSFFYVKNVNPVDPADEAGDDENLEAPSRGGTTCRHLQDNLGSHGTRNLPAAAIAKPRSGGQESLFRQRGSAPEGFSIDTAAISTAIFITAAP